MKAEYCVDYLSHQWNTDDLITTFKETRKQRQKYVVNNIHGANTCILIKNEKKLKKFEDYKLKRFQNALWRSMAKNCTNHLGKSNQLIHPATVSWQKESDITWLYGPMFTATIGATTTTQKKTSSSSLQGLKPVLKKQSNVAQQHQLLLPSNPDFIFHYSISPSIPPHNTCDDDEYNQYYLSSATSSGLTSNRSSFSSISSSSIKSVGVHFNPEIIEIEYQPEYPVSTSTSPHSCVQHYDGNGGDSIYNDSDYDSDYDEEDALWSLLVQASEGLKSSTYTQISFLFSKCLFFYNQQKKATTKKKLPQNQVFVLFVSVIKSIVSLTTTWLLYQNFSSWLSAPKPAVTTSTNTASAAAGQSTSKQSKKACLIIL